MISQLHILLFAQAAKGWSDVIFDLDEGMRFVLLLVIIGCGTGVILGSLGIVAGMLNSTHRRRVEETLKRDILDRGMSAEEIATVIESAAPPEDGVQRWVATWGKKK